VDLLLLELTRVQDLGFKVGQLLFKDGVLLDGRLKLGRLLLCIMAVGQLFRNLVDLLL
jgi:hypothetical protein